jgi:UPF0716 family protein affecting phage T7 exclusion
VPGTDRRAAFVGLEAYRQAGGHIVTDLFQSNDEGYLADPALLDRLCAERLEREAEAIRAEGWKRKNRVKRADEEGRKAAVKLLHGGSLLAPSMALVAAA